MSATFASLNASVAAVGGHIGGGAVWDMDRPDPGQKEWADILDRLNGFSGLQDDWDGLGAKAPSLELVGSALEFARLLRQIGHEPPSSVAAGPDGTVLFDWQAGPLYVEAEITTPYHAEWMQVVPGQPARHWVFEHFTQNGIAWMHGDREQHLQRLVPDRWIDTSTASVLCPSLWVRDLAKAE